ncbi:MAG: glycine zipper domain-containing protein [Pseudomonadota bacterium]|nr:glycine zipper domain-containing protein [Pseudomonadota bacterium]
MKMKSLLVFLSLSVTSLGAVADDTADAALGGGIGGAIGAAIGNEVGGRDGAILGGAVGAATGAAITTKDDREYYYQDHDRRRHDYDHDDRRSYRKSGGHFCPPGQAKKGNC